VKRGARIKRENKLALFEKVTYQGKRICTERYLSLIWVEKRGGWSSFRHLESHSPKSKSSSIAFLSVNGIPYISCRLTRVISEYNSN